MPDRIAFVVAEAGAADFVAPALAKLIRDPAVDCVVYAGPAAAPILRRHAGGDLALIELPDTDADPGPSVVEADRLVISAGRTRWMETHALRAARRAGVPAIQFVDAWYGFRMRFVRGDALEMADRVMVIDEACRTAAIADGLPAERLVCVGHPAFEAAAPLPEARADHVLVLGSPIREILGDSLGYDQHDCWRVVREAAAARPDLFAELRYAAHPEERAIPDGAEPIDTAEGLRRCGTVIGSFAAPMVSAFLGGRRVVSVQFAAPEKSVLVTRGLAPLVTDAAGLIVAMARPGDAAAAAFRRDFQGSADRVLREIGAIARIGA